MTFLSVVIPTRNRPGYLRASLNSLANQTNNDFSVVICDNSDDDSSKSVVSQFDGRLRLDYLKTDGKLSMVENWNLGVSRTTGAYVAVMIDKTMWNPRLVSTLSSTLNQCNESDVVSWANESYYPDSGGWGAGLYVVAREARVPRQEIALLDALIQRRMFTRPREEQDVHSYCLGKICFGIYSSRLINKIKSTHGQLFHPLNPDYTSLTLASFYSRGSIKLGLPMQVSFQTSVSNGFLSKSDPRNALSYIRSVDPYLDSINKLPLPGLYQSIENSVAYDLVQFDKSAGIRICEPNLANLRKLVLREIASSPTLDLSFASDQTLREIDQILNPTRSNRSMKLQRLVASSRTLAYRKVLSNRVLLRCLAASLRYKSIRCKHPQAALAVQDDLNLRWIQATGSNEVR